MTILSKVITPSNAMFFLEGSNNVSAPMPALEKIQILSNSESILVPCQPECDGDTRLTVGDSSELVQKGQAVFDGTISTKDGVLLVHDVGLDELLRFPVKSAHTRVRIWTDRPDFPTKVVVGVD